ncbi:hypothetical protein JCM8208_007591 [Rhodotorula glutinis]
MAPPDHLSSPLSSLSPVSPRSPSSISRTHLGDDNFAQHPADELGDTLEDQQQRGTAAGQHEWVGASEVGGRVEGDGSAGSDDFVMGEFGLPGLTTARDRTGEGSREGHGGGALEQEVEDKVDEEVSPTSIKQVKQEEHSPEASRTAFRTPSPRAHVEQVQHDTVETSSRSNVTWQPSGRIKPGIYSSPRTSRPREPPLTPRSNRVVLSFDLSHYAERRTTPPPPSHAAYRYTFPLPLPSFGPRIIGVHGTVCHEFKRESNVCELHSLFRRDGSAYIIVTGTRAAIKHILILIEAMFARHSKFSSHEHRYLQQHGLGWCRFNERNLEPLVGYWVHDVFAERGAAQRPVQAPSTAHHLVADQGWPGRASSSRHRRSSRSLSPDRASCRSPVDSVAQPVRPRRSLTPTAPSLEPPAEVKSAKVVDRRSSRYGDSGAASPGTSYRSPSSFPSGSALADNVEEPASSLSIPIPIAAIERFIGPNAAGHFITQTTGVRIKVEAGLDGATLRLDLETGTSTRDSLSEARALVDKVLVSGGFVAPPRASNEDPQRDRRSSRAHVEPDKPHHTREERSSARREGGAERRRQDEDGDEERERSSRDDRWAVQHESSRRERKGGWANERGQERRSGERSSREEHQNYSPAVDRDTQQQHRSHSRASARRHEADSDGNDRPRFGPSQGYPPAPGSTPRTGTRTPSYHAAAAGTYAHVDARQGGREWDRRAVEERERERAQGQGQGWGRVPPSEMVSWQRQGDGRAFERREWDGRR